LPSASLDTLRLSPCSTLFPYTTRFRSAVPAQWRCPPYHDGRQHKFLRAYPSYFILLSVLAQEKSLFDNTFFQIFCEVGLDVFFGDRKSTRLNSSHVSISYAVFCWKDKL